MSIANNEIIIRLVGKLTLEFPDIDQLKVRQIAEEVLYKYDIIPQETGLVASDIEDRVVIYLACKKLDGLSKKTLKNYNYELIRFASHLIKPIAAITTMDLRMYLAQRCKNLRPSTTNTQIYTLRSFFKWLHEEEYIPKNPAIKLKATKEPIRERKPLSEENVEIFRQACITDREKALTEFIYSSGCRLSEVEGVNISEVNWHERTLMVIGKGDKEREVCFSIKAKVLMKKYLLSRKGTVEALFITSKNPFKRLGGRSIERVIEKIKIRSGLTVDIFPHIFRHSMATHCINAGMPIHILQELMGHTTVATTQIYAKTSKENIKHEHRKIS
ncbi:tyrosine-type recombinase/integrase [Clostridium sp.]|jgi:integrase/recombinase XerD|uniref:tyrosine-type recombinase/integrase n=1 Tax=Clostridium sp. TaxID=1506 RepID=UPI003EED8D0D